MKLKTALICVAFRLAAQTFAARYEILVGDPTAEVNTTSALVFVPELVNATHGDTVSFVFAAPWSNHRVVEGVSARPCAKAADGFDSGWRPVAGNVSENSTFQFVVQTSEPVFFFCAQPDGDNGRPHCLDGMVGAISADPASLDAFRASAMALSELPALPTSAISRATPSSRLSATESDSERKTNQSKLAVGLTLGLLGVFFLLLWCFCRQQDRKLKRALQQPLLIVATPTSPTFDSSRPLASPRESAWRLDLPFVIPDLNDPPSASTAAMIRPPPAAATRLRDNEELDLPRYEDRRADVLLDQAAPTPSRVPTTAQQQQEAPPPDYVRTRHV